MAASSPAVEKVQPNVYDITWQGTDEGPELMQGYRWRSFLFDFEDDLPTLVDTAKAERVDVLMEGIEQTGVTPERLIVTHRHSDHADGFDAVVEEYGVETWVPEADNLVEAERLSVETPADNLYGDRETIGRFEAVHIPGHTPGNSSLVDESGGVAAMGDSVSGADRRGLPAGYLIHPPQSTNVNMSPQDVVDAEENLVKLLDYDFDVALVAHGSSVFENAREKLWDYVNFEVNYVADEPSIHRPSRKGMGEKPDFY